MYYGQFYIKSAMSDKLIHALGDRGVFILDGRNSLHTQLYDCKEWAIKHKFLAYQVFKGESFCRSKPLSELYMVDQ